MTNILWTLTASDLLQFFEDAAVFINETLKLKIKCHQMFNRQMKNKVDWTTLFINVWI